MINFAWSNPSTGLREQTRKIAWPSILAAEGQAGRELRTLEVEARQMLWGELQKKEEHGIPSEHIWLQCEVGSVSREGDHVDLEAAKWVEGNMPESVFAYADPRDGKRCIAQKHPGPMIRSRLPDDDFVERVILYATIPYGETVERDGPRPELPVEWNPILDSTILGPEDHPGRSSPSEISRLKEELNNYVDLDGAPYPRSTAWALLDIAESMRAENPGRCRRNPRRRIRRRRLGLWERFKLWIFGEPEPDDPDGVYRCANCGASPIPPLRDDFPLGDGLCGPCAIATASKLRQAIADDFNAEFAGGPLFLCTCTGDGIRPSDGSFCSCDQGRMKMRQAEIGKRKEKAE